MDWQSPNAPNDLVSLQPLTLNYLSDVARVHVAAFPSSALTKLGNEAVQRYYHWQLTGPHDVYAIAGFANEALVGFCIGGIFRGALSGYVRKNRRFLMLRVLLRPWLLSNPIFRERISLALKLGKRKKKPGPISNVSVQSFGILAIAVHPQYQGHGVGRLLMQDAELHARREGFTRMHLTVEPSNSNAIRFYLGLGWEKVEKENAWTGQMQKWLS